MKLGFYIILALMPITCCVADRLSQNIYWSLLSSDRGMIAINQDDKTEISVIINETGLSEFIQLYGITPTLPGDTFSTNVIVAVFSLPGICVDNFKSQCTGCTTYYIDLVNTGIQFEMSAPPQGKNWTSVTFLQVDKSITSGTLMIRSPTATNRKDFGRN